MLVILIFFNLNAEVYASVLKEPKHKIYSI